jgi:GT2 family glycosyltransferase
MTMPVSISVVVPSHNSLRTVVQCTDAVLAALGPHDELIVVDDGSSDGTFERYRDDPDPRVIAVRCPTNIGRGPARNRGAERASGDVVLFVDADVVVHSDTVEQVRAAFDESTVTALFGAYDQRPADPGSTSQFRNLLHHHTHHHAGPTASHFWTGLGAVRADVFGMLGGFDEARWARNMEDVELGHRINDAGHVVHVRPSIQGTHLKAYSVRSMVRSDLFDRAIPWTRLLLTDHRADRFVLSARQRWSSLGAAMVPSALILAVAWRWALVMVILGAAIFVISNLHVWRFFRDVRGSRFLVVAVPLLLVHSLASVVGLVVGSAVEVGARIRRAARRGWSRAVPGEVGAEPEVVGTAGLLSDDESV